MHTFHPRVVMHVPRTHGDFIVVCRHVIESLTNNQRFPSPTPQLSVFKAQVDAYEAALAAAQTHAKGQAAAANAELKKTMDMLHQLEAYVQSIVTTAPTPVDAAAWAASAGMGTQQHGVHMQPEISAKMGPGGLVLLRKHAHGVHGGAYEWQVSSDGGKTWTSLPATDHSTTSVVNLVVGQAYQFRARHNKGGTTGDWTDPVTLLVH